MIRMYMRIRERTKEEQEAIKAFMMYETYFMTNPAMSFVLGEIRSIAGGWYCHDDIEKWDKVEWRAK